MLGDRDEAERYRRLADDRRRSLPPRGGGMGADVDPDGPSAEVGRGDPGVAAMTIGKPRAIQIGLATGCLALVAAAAALLLPAASRPDPGLDGLEPLLAARRFDEAERRIGEYLRANPDDARRPTC